MTSGRMERLIELFVRVQIYILAAFYALKELYFEATNQGIAARLNDEISLSPILLRPKKIAVVTGADGTIGLEVTKRLLGLGFDVRALVKHRDGSSLSSLLKDFSKERLRLYEVDLSCPRRVARFLDSFVSSETVHLVVLSAGVMLTKENHIEGLENHMCVNLVSQALLLEKLREHLSSDARIVALSSTCLRTAYNHRQLEGNLLDTYIGPYHAYAMSKLALTIYIEEFARRRNLQAVSMHPGVVPGHLYRNLSLALKLITYFVLPFVMRTPSFSSKLVIHTALRRNLVAGAYYEDLEPRRVLDWYSDIQKDAVYNAVQAKIRQFCE